MSANVDSCEEVAHLKEQIQRLEIGIRFRDKEISELERLLRLANRDREAEVDKKTSHQRVLADHQAHSAELQVKLQNLQDQKNNICKWYQHEKKKCIEMRTAKDQMKSTYDETITQLNKRITSLELEMQKQQSEMQKQHSEMETYKSKCAELKVKLSDSENALQQERKKCSDLEDSLRDAMRTIESQMKRPLVDFGLNNITDDELKFRYVDLKQRHIHNKNHDAHLIRKLEKQLQQQKDVRVEKKEVDPEESKDALKIAELERVIREQQKEIKLLQAEMHMYSSSREQLKKEKDMLEKAAKYYKKAFLDTKSKFRFFTESVRNEPDSVKPEAEAGVRPTDSADLVVTNSKKFTALPPISKKPCPETSSVPLPPISKKPCPETSSVPSQSAAVDHVGALQPQPPPPRRDNTHRSLASRRDWKIRGTKLMP